MSIQAILSNLKELYGLSETDVEKYQTRYDRMVNEFSIPEKEAEISITAEIKRAAGVIDDSGSQNLDKIHPTVRLPDLNPETMSEADVEGMAVSLTRYTSGKKAYSGIITDSEGFVPFVVLNGAQSVPLEQGKSYRMYGGIVSVYNGSVSLLFNKFSYIEISKTTFDTPPFNRTLVADLQPGVCDIHTKAVRVNSAHEKAKYLLTLADESGQTFAAVWDREHPGFDCLLEGLAYRIRFAICNTRPDGSKFLNLEHARLEPSGETLDVQTGSSVVGECTSIRRGEIVLRCPLCRKKLELSGLNLKCPDHGSQQEPIEEVRVRIRIDDGNNTWTAYLGPNAIKSISGLDNQELLKMCRKNPLREAMLEPWAHALLFGKKITLTGNQIDDNLFVDRIEFAHPATANIGQTVIEGACS